MKRRSEHGFSMVELMVAVTLALVITGGAISVFVGSRSAFQNTTGVQTLTDGGRFALGFIEQSARGAGYMACNTAARQINLLNAGSTPLPYTFTQPVGGFEASNTGVGDAYPLVSAPVTPDPALADWAGNLDAALANRVIQNNDVLLVRSTLAQIQPAYVTAIVDGANNFTVNVPSGFAAGQLAVISDCAKSAAFQITGVAPSGANAIISHGLGGSPGNTVAAFPVSFDIGSQVTAVTTTVYYIGRGADGNSALFAYDLNGTNSWVARELVSNIEAMQVLYGVDTNGTQTVSRYLTANQVADFNSVMAIKVAVLAASPLSSTNLPTVARTFNLLGTTVTAPLDTRLRQVFEVTIAVRNSVT